MPQDFYSKLEKLLKQDTRFIDQEGDLLKSNVIDAAYKADKKLVELLLSKAEFKKKFFSKVRDALVFNINDFVAYIQDKNFLADSYTKYRNKIGLNIDGKFLNERKEVALVWPFKDCVLEGGMTKEDEKRKEIFFNEILAQDEIDKLLAPKVLTNWKRYTQDGEEKVKELKRDENGIIRENLIIKGNNLLALHSLKQQFQNEIKLIYIDPPYNTGNDSFGYNDNFNHSTWLTFMKNRLEVARELLRDDGVIFVQIGHNENAYLRILMDEVFGRDRFINEITWKKYSGVKNQASKKLTTQQETILFYSKTENYEINMLFNPLSEEYIKHEYKYIDKHGRRYAKLRGRGYQDKNRKTKIKYLDENPGSPITTLWDEEYLQLNTSSSEKLKDFIGQKPEQLIRRIIDLTTNEGDIILDFFLGSGTTAVVAHKMGRQYIGIEQLDYGENDAVVRLQNVIGRKKKKNDKMFDELKYDQSGISKVVGWKGGGNFIYCELMKYNERFVERIQKAKDTKELLKIWEEMSAEGGSASGGKVSAFLNYNVDIKKFDESIDEFKKFPLAKQKRTLFDLLNKNQLYVNLSEIEDREFGVKQEDKKLNEKFYKTKTL